jgi:hypothetical protein
LRDRRHGPFLDRCDPGGGTGGTLWCQPDDLHRQRGPWRRARPDDQPLAAKHGAKAADTVAIRSREAAGGVVSYAETNGFDHIVMGTGDKRGMSRLILGSVAGEVAGRAHCSVTVAR